LLQGSSISSAMDLNIRTLSRASPRPCKPVSSKEVVWQPPRLGCIKLNIDGSSFGSPSSGAVGVVIRDWENNFLGGFAQNIGHASAFVAELSAAMFAIEKAVEMHWGDVWIETNSLMVLKALYHQLEVPWMLRVRWLNCIALTQTFTCNFSHIHREGNAVADALAKNGLNLPSLHSQWWLDPPHFILPLLQRDSIDFFA